MPRFATIALMISCAAPMVAAQEVPVVPLSVPESTESGAEPASPPNIVVQAPVHVTADSAATGALTPIPIMTIDQDALFLRSAWGRRVQAEIEARSHALATENDKLATGFSQEEQQLTELRKTLPVEEFRARADEFDKRVVEVRRERDAKARELQLDAEAARDAFLQAVLPILAKLMQERGAVVVLDQRMLFVSADLIDVTQDLIDLVDQAEGTGENTLPKASQSPEPVQPAPTQQEPVPPATVDSGSPENAPAETAPSGAGQDGAAPHQTTSGEITAPEPAPLP